MEAFQTLKKTNHRLAFSLYLCFKIRNLSARQKTIAIQATGMDF